MMEPKESIIEDVVNSLDTLQRASAPPFFAAKTMHRIFSPAEIPSWQRWIIFKPAFIAASLGAFLLLNCWFIYTARQSTLQLAAKQESGIQQLAYELNVTSTYTLTDK